MLLKINNYANYLVKIFDENNLKNTSFSKKVHIYLQELNLTYRPTLLPNTYKNLTWPNLQSNQFSQIFTRI